MEPIKITLDKPCQEFEIAGKVYETYYDDESLKKYTEKADKVEKKMEKQKKVNVDKLTKPQQDLLEKEMRSMIRDLIDMFFGEGSFDQIYEDSRKSLIIINRKVVPPLFKWLSEVSNFKIEEIENYYTE